MRWGGFLRGVREGWAALRQSGFALVGWGFGYPLTRFWSRDRKLTLALGRPGPVFADNSKYQYAFLHRERADGERVVFLAGDRRIVEQIRAAGGDAELHPTFRSLRLVARCGRLFIDMADWYDFGVFPLSRGARIVQLWHGAPLKHIELDLHRHRMGKTAALGGVLLSAQKALVGRYPVFDCVVTTSQGFTEAAFRGAFRATRFVNTGYPRNDVLVAPEGAVLHTDRLVAINLDHDSIRAVERAKRDGLRIVLYVPTYRKNGGTPFDRHLSLERLSAFASARRLLIVVKGHPLMRVPDGVGRYANLMAYAAQGDVYPLLRWCDALVTDYSSIYLDFLLLDRPIVFFAYDLDEYLRHDSGMYFDYREFTPGPVCFDQDELEQALERTLERTLEPGEVDPFAGKRARIRTFTHDHQDDQSARRVRDACKS